MFTTCNRDLTHDILRAGGMLDIYPCRKDARRMERGRRTDQAQRRDGGHPYQPYASRTAVSWSRDPVE